MNPSKLIDDHIARLKDWRAETLGEIRRIILKTVPGVVEEWKWMGTPVWYGNGMICTGEAYNKCVKTTFAKGAGLPDPKKLFNAGLDGNVRRAIDFFEGDRVDETGFRDLLLAAYALNSAKPKDGKPKSPKPKPKPAKSAPKKARKK